MTTKLPVNSLCESCRRPVLWAELPSGKRVPLDRSDAGPVRLVRTEYALLAEFLSTAELLEVFAQQRAATGRGEPVEQLYSVHNAACRERAKQMRQQRRPRRRGRRRPSR